MAYLILRFLAFLLVAVLAYGVAFRFERRLGRPARLTLWLVSGAFTALWAVFDLYYLHLYDDWTWLYRVRAIWGIELTLAFVGVFCALLQRRVLAGISARYRFLRHSALLLLLVFVVPPFMKPILRPPSPRWGNRWKEGVCLQSTAYTCGPSSVATLLRHYGVNVSEQEVSRAVYLSSGGTEAWYLVRYLRSAGMNVRFVSTPPNPGSYAVPCIAGVRLRGSRGPGHFITLLDQTSSTLTIGDPLVGRSECPKEKVREKYYMTGFFLHVVPK